MIVLKKILSLITIAFIISIISTNVFAVESDIEPKKNGELKQNGEIKQDIEKFKGKVKEMEKDHQGPLKKLEEKKEIIEKEYQDGKITKEQAEEKQEKIDKHIEKVKEFEKLPLPQKKEKISDKVKSKIEKDVQEGKITKDEGDKILKEFNQNLEKWDGSENPKMMKRKCDKCDKD